MMAGGCSTEADSGIAGITVGLPVSSICKYVNRSCERSRCLKDGEAAYDAGDVIECTVKRVCGQRFSVSAVVLRNSGSTDGLHKVTAEIEKNEVVEANCTCKDGNYKCKHVVAVLLCMHEERSFGPQSTDIPQRTISVDNGKPNKPCKQKEVLDLPCLEKLTIKEEPPHTEDAPVPSARASRDNLQKPAVPALTTSAVECLQDPKQKCLLVGSAKTLKAAVYAILDSKGQHEKGLSVEDMFKTLCDQHCHSNAKEVECATRGQSCSMLWQEHRVGMITASVAYSVYTRVQTIRTTMGPHDMRALLKLLMREEKVANKDMLRGIDLEPVAKEAYRRQNMHHRDLQLHECGLYILPGKPFIGASPDAIVTCACCSPRLLEVKCPKILEKFVKSEITNYSSAVHMKRNSRYFCQTQVQMGVTGLASTDLFAYVDDTKNMTVNVTFSQAYFDDVVERATFFFKHYVLPHMIQLAA